LRKRQVCLHKIQCNDFGSPEVLVVRIGGQAQYQKCKAMWPGFEGKNGWYCKSDQKVIEFIVQNFKESITLMENID